MHTPRIPRAAPTFLVWSVALACAALALFGCAGCSAVKPMGGAVAGAAAGALVGPVGMAVGAAAGAGAGALWQETQNAKDERATCQTEVEALQADVLELRATIRANAQIDAYNLTATRKTPHLTPVDADESHWYSRLWVWLVGLAGVSLGYVFRATLWTWIKWLAAYVVGLMALARSASPAPVEAPPLDPPHPSDP